MKIFKTEKKEKTTKTALKNIDGRYCIYHHGLGVLKHECGTILCRECLWESAKCPNCEKPIDRGKVCTRKVPGSERSSVEPALLKPRRVMLTPSGPPGTQPEIRPEPPIRRFPISKSSEPKPPTTQIQKRETVALSKERADEKKERFTSTKTPAPTITDSGKTPPVTEESAENQEGDNGVIDIYDDDIDAKKRSRVPKYKKMRHARLEPGSEDETDEDEKDPKKWEVRTVPPVQKRRDYESL